MGTRISQKDAHLQKLRDAIRVKHYPYSTEKTYCGWVSRFWEAALVMPKGLSREAKIEAFLTDLAKGDCAASTQNQALDAIRFFFKNALHVKLGDIDALRAKRQPVIRYAPPRPVTLRLIKAVPNLGGYPTNLIARLLYGCGMRVMEPLKLRIKDVDFSRSRLLLYNTKGNQCRIVRLPCSLFRELRAQIAFAEKMWERDMLAGLHVHMPNRLGRKAPRNAMAKGWYYVFPALRPCPDPRTGEMVRYHMHERNVQRATAIGAEKVGLAGIFTPHNFRHCYADHLLDAGENICSVQKSLGHKQLQNTMGYVHADAMSLTSPLDLPEEEPALAAVA